MEQIVDGAARDSVANERLEAEGILCVFRGFQSAQLRQKIRRAVGKLFRRHAPLKRERGEFHIHPAVAPVSLIRVDSD